MSRALTPYPSSDLSAPCSIQAGIRCSSSEIEYQHYLVRLFQNGQDSGRSNNSDDDLPTKRTMAMHHPWHNVTIGHEWPDVINAVIEIPAYSRVKTELDHDTGLLHLDYIINSSVIYPANYGFVPETLANENGGLPILVLCQLSIPPLSIVRCRPIGVMPLVRGNSCQYKLIAVAMADPEYGQYDDVGSLPPFKLLTIVQFFNDYRAMEGREVKGLKPMGTQEARRIVKEARTAYRAHFDVDE
jgi:inorganic pyrophosphatase